MLCIQYFINVFEKKITHQRRLYQADLWSSNHRRPMMKNGTRPRISNYAMLLTYLCILSVASCAYLSLLCLKRTKCYPITQSFPVNASSAARPHQWVAETTLMETLCYVGIVTSGFTVSDTVLKTTLQFQFLHRRTRWSIYMWCSSSPGVHRRSIYW